MLGLGLDARVRVIVRVGVRGFFHLKIFLSNSVARCPGPPLPILLMAPFACKKAL